MRPVNESLPMLLMRARETVMSYFRPVLDARGLSEQQWRVLRVLYEKPEISAHILAEHCYILSPSLTRILNRLEQEKLISRRRAENDMREQRICLTQKARNLVEELSPMLEAQYQRIQQSFRPEAMEQFYALLRELIQSSEQQK